MLISIDPDNQKGCVDFLGVKREVCLSLVPSAKIGDFVLVHAGFAIEQLDPDMAKDLTSMLEELGEKLEEIYGSESLAHESFAY
ncbi:MAG: HypC/HybG/HupF family hydrogenase formation chaperone [Firmicutes bacterium]|nr:HypC/HybG/HupF family hydrogenase formation chaperone [Bacillota bacterium]